ncbi:peroxiredoxin [Ilumatobacteraceae bacterium]|nr:peroxiredoxin [Ilumatobacteraceae bacterium]
MSGRSVRVGDQAPDFDVPGTGDRHWTLSEFRGRAVVLVFYPGDDTPVCTRQLNSYNDDLSQFEHLDAQVLGISAQDVQSHERFAERHGLRIPLLADVDKEVAQAYGTLGPLGFPRRSVVIVDQKGIIRFVHRAMAGITFRPVTELVGVLEAL